jgi:hypothetical protein
MALNVLTFEVVLALITFGQTRGEKADKEYVGDIPP